MGPKILVCGGRNFADRKLLARTLAELAPALIVHGGCPTGADHLTELWALDHGVPTRVYLAQWRLYGRRAGPLRNQQMIDSEPELKLVVAFAGGRGTADMMRRARAAGLNISTPTPAVTPG